MEVKTITTTNNLSPKAKADYELVLRAIDGEEKAYTLLMTRYRNSIFHMMLKMINNRDDADDLTLEAFGKAFRKLPSYAPRYAFSTWLFKIASNNCIDFIRKKRIKVTSMDTGIVNNNGDVMKIDAKSTNLNPEESVMKGQRIVHLRLLVSKLKPKYRELVEKRYFQELSYEEIATEMNLPLGTVKAQLFRARDFLSSMAEKTKDSI